MIDTIAIVTGVAGVLFGLRCYLELRKWARQCQNARIAIAYNQRVKLNAPLVEWLTWANALAKDESSTGRVVYLNGKTSVAILRPDKDTPKYNPDAAKRVQKKAEANAA